MGKQKIVSIEIELKDYEPIKFTMDEAKELHEQLDALFGDKTTHVHHHRNLWDRPYYTWCTNTNNTNGHSNNEIRSISIGQGVSGYQANIFSLSDLVGKSVASSNTNMKVSYHGDSAIGTGVKRRGAMIGANMSGSP